MKYRFLGKSGLRVSEIGFGAWGIGGDAYGRTEDQESKKALACALERGINFFDTSDIYGAGHSEILLGEVLSPERERVILATKGGTLPHTGKHMPQDFSAIHLRAALKSSLERLRTEYVDLYQLHSPDVPSLPGEVYEELDSFKRQGRTRAIGVSVRHPDDGLTAMNYYDFDAIQVNFNLIDQRALDIGLFALARAKNVGLIIRTPFNFGFLTGAVKDIHFGEKDHRANWPEVQRRCWADSADLFNSLCEKERRTKAQLALLFCLAFDSVTSVIPGMLTCEEVQENSMSSELKALDQDELAAIGQIYRANVFFDPGLKQNIAAERYDKLP